MPDQSPTLRKEGPLMFDQGDAVMYRELWGGRVMTAIPLRVVADEEQGTVLYLAAGTRFRAGRAPDGGPVRDLADWISVPAQWAGGSAIRLVPAECWYCIDVEFDESSDFAGYYVNFQTPVVRTPTGFDTVDLVLDLMVSPDGSDQLKDVEDFQTAIAAGHITAAVADAVGREVERLRRVIAGKGYPDDAAQWVGWRPPESWEIPTLAETWHVIRT